MRVHRRGAASIGLAAVTLAVAVAGGCTAAEPEHRPVIVAPGAPGEPGQVLTEAPIPAPATAHTAADVAFVHLMIAHHEQALRMTGLVGDRTGRADIALFARRIEISQQAEITRMEEWLEVRGEPASGGHDRHGAAPGMLTEDQFGELAAASGEEFDRRFLELMAYHHEGALIMVDQLRAAGGGQEAELFELVNHIDADQRIEIGRMHRLLAGMAGE